MATDELLTIRGLSIVYQTDIETVHAVNGIDITLSKGQTLGLVGETGAGKTTTALSILRLLPKGVGRITGGSIRFSGQEIVKLTEADMRLIRGERISMIFQDPMSSLNPVLSVGEQIAEAIRLHNKELSKAALEEKVDEILKLVGIPACRKVEYPHQFSGGMKQRVVIAIALACNPELIIADEPTTALDVTIQAQILALMDDLKRSLGTSMLLITHDLGIVAEICDMVAIMYAGEIIEVGTVEDLYESSDHHPYTVGLFASVPSLSEECDRLRPIGGLMPDPTDLPPGCKFHPRCPHCMEICKKQPPGEWRRDTHAIRCHLYPASVEERN